MPAVTLLIKTEIELEIQDVMSDSVSHHHRTGVAGCRRVN
jgi:hypothetical protein